jgi:hypothetical protein
VERRFAEDGVANICLTDYLGGHNTDDTIALADACIKVARDLATRFSG